MEQWRRWFRTLVGPRARDWLVFSLSLIALVGLGLGVWNDAGFPRAALFDVIGLLGALSLFWRRRFPVAVTLLTCAIAFGTAMSVMAGFALMTLAVRRRDRVLIACTVVCAFSVSAPSGWSTPWQARDLIAATVAAVICALIGAYVGARRDLLASLRERADRAEKERELRAEQARVAERARIAREMHDVLAHKVSLIALQAGALEVNPGQGPERVEQSAAQIRSTARATLEDLRGVLGVLRTDAAPLAPQPELSDLDRLVAESVAAGVAVTLQVQAPAEVPGRVGRTAYRVVQEALTNVHKHARGARTAVEVSTAGDCLIVQVENARPVALGSLLPGSGSGLAGLAERVELANGTLTAGPTPGGGWRVTARLPLTPQAPADEVPALIG